MLPPIDQDYLNERAPGHSVSIEGGMTSIVWPAFCLPPGFTTSASDLLLRLSPGYPDVPPDMWWFSPSIVRTDGRPIRATEHIESYLGRTWQRWSRHFNGGQWRPGLDSLESYVALVRQELASAVRGLAA